MVIAASYYESTKYMSMWIEEKIRNKTLSILDIVQV
jgi:hypothetical protein